MVKTSKIRNSKRDEVIKVDWFHANFKNKYSKSDLKIKGRGTTTVPLSIYKKVILEYFDIYMKELYLLDNTNYFLLGGTLTKCRTNDAIQFIETDVLKDSKRKNQAITLFWGNRPTKLFSYSTRICKQQGTTSRIYKIENMFKANNSIDNLPKFDVLIKKSFTEKKIYNLTKAL